MERFRTHDGIELAHLVGDPALAAAMSAFLDEHTP
jgi:hypothetical protein